jgi:hypothetical protein
MGMAHLKKKIQLKTSEQFKSPGKWHTVIRPLDPDISRDCTAFIFEVLTIQGDWLHEPTDPENEGTTILWNTGKYLQINMA